MSFKNTFISRLNKYKYLFIVPISIIVIFLVASGVYNWYLSNKANKYSLVFNNIQEQLANGKEKEALQELVKLSKQGTKGYKFVSLLQQASISLHKKQYLEAIKHFEKINKLNIPQYYKDFANTMVYSIKLDNDKDLKPLINKLSKIKKDNAFYFTNLELLAVALYETKQYPEAIKTANQIITSDTALASIKERAKSLKSIALAYVK